MKKRIPSLLLLLLLCFGLLLRQGYVSANEIPASLVASGTCGGNHTLDWAYSNNITSGKTATTFEIRSDCQRQHVVTFLYRYLKERK